MAARKQPEKVKRVYIGPSIPKSSLRKGMILEGTEADISAFVEKMATRYPEITRLLVQVNKLAEAQEKTMQKGNILHKYYNDMAAKAVCEREG